MKDFLKTTWLDFLDSGIPAFAILIGIISAIIWKPVVLLWILAAVGVIALYWMIQILTSWNP